MAPTSGNTSSSGRLRCTFRAPFSDDGQNETSSQESTTLWFQPYQGKRSSFMLDIPPGTGASTGDDETPPTHQVINGSPCHCYVEYVANEAIGDNTAKGTPVDYFFLGGLQLISTARSVEVFVTRKDSDEEELLMTCRGIPVRDDSSNMVSNCFKIFSVVPGGPRPVHRLHLHLLPGEQPTAPTSPTSEASPTAYTPITKLVSIQLTGRIPDAHLQQQQQTPNKSQILTPSSAMMMQQMMMTAPSGQSGTPTLSQPSGGGGLGGMATPLASGSTPRNPFFSPHSADSSQRPPMTPSFQARPNNTIATTNQASPTINNNFLGNNNTASSEAIIAGVSFLVRSEGQTTQQVFQNELSKHDHAVQQRLQSMEQRLQRQETLLDSMAQQNQVLLQRQLEMMTLMQQQQQQYQWMAMMNMMQQPINHQPNSSEPPQGFPNMDAVAEGETERQAPLISSPNFPKEPSYDPTCRVDMSDFPIPIQEDETKAPHSSSSTGHSKDDDNNDDVKDDTNGGDAAKKGKEGEDDDGEDEEDKNDVIVRGKHDQDDDDDQNGDIKIFSQDDDKSSQKEKQEGQESHQPKDNQNNDEGESDSDENASTQKEREKNDQDMDSTMIGTLSESYSGTYSNESKLCENDGDDENSNSGENRSAQQVPRDFLFESSRKGIFPSLSSTVEDSHEIRMGVTFSEFATDRNGQDRSSNSFPSIRRSASMVDHLSIHCSPSDIKFPSLSSRTTSMSHSMDQAESIEVLAVFQESPTATIGSSRSHSSTPSSAALPTAASDPALLSDGDHSSSNTSGQDKSENEVGQSSESEGNSLSSYYADEEDLVSVSLVENGNTKSQPSPAAGIAKTNDITRTELPPELLKHEKLTPLFWERVTYTT